MHSLGGYSRARACGPRRRSPSRHRPGSGGSRGVRRDPAVVDEPQVSRGPRSEQLVRLPGVDVAAKQMRDLAIERQGQVRVEPVRRSGAAAGRAHRRRAICAWMLASSRGCRSPVRKVTSPSIARPVPTSKMYELCPIRRASSITCTRRRPDVITTSAPARWQASSARATSSVNSSVSGPEQGAALGPASCRRGRCRRSEIRRIYSTAARPGPPPRSPPARRTAGAAPRGRRRPRRPPAGRSAGASRWCRSAGRRDAGASSTDCSTVAAIGVSSASGRWRFWRVPRLTSAMPSSPTRAPDVDQHAGLDRVAGVERAAAAAASARRRSRPRGAGENRELGIEGVEERASAQLGHAAAAIGSCVSPILNGPPVDRLDELDLRDASSGPAEPRHEVLAEVLASRRRRSRRCRRGGSPGRARARRPCRAAGPVSGTSARASWSSAPALDAIAGCRRSSRCRPPPAGR